MSIQKTGPHTIPGASQAAQRGFSGLHLLKDLAKHVPWTVRFGGYTEKFEAFPISLNW